MKIARLAAAAAFALSLTLALAPAQAAPLTFNFSGTVSAILSDDSSGTFGANFSLGQSVAGSWTFDSNAVGVPSLPYLTSYASTFVVTIGARTFSGSSEYRIFDNGPGGDGFSVINETGTYAIPPLGPLTASTFFVQFEGMPTSTLASQALVLNPAAIASLANPNYAPNGLRLDNPDGSWGGLYFTAAVVPEPASGALLACGLVLTGQLLRRRRVPA